jgi:hypothetical protein
MASAIILTKQKQQTKKIESSDFPISSLSTKGNLTKSISTVSYGKTSNIFSADFPISTISENKRSAKIIDVLPFRIRFTSIMVPGYSYPNNVPPIGIAVIGFNNYIL